MIKKITSLIIILFFSFFVKTNVFSFSIPVENVFNDITSEYKYIEELQELYDKGMIVPDSNGNFNPYQLLTRDDFVGIASEVSCKKCIQPNTDIYFIEKYNQKPFFDINKSNKNFYCIAESKENNFVKGYDVNYKCDDGTYQEGERPFCLNNNIILEEALAVVLRMSGILTNEEAEKIRQDIYNGKITESLSDDVNPKNLDGSVYSFYPDFLKALEYQVIEYDNYGNPKSYYLVEKINNKLRPKKNITKEEFLRMAFVALKANSCQEKVDDKIALKINIYDKTCDKTKINCSLSDLKDSENTYDFNGEVGGICEKGINLPEGYIWRYYNKDTKEEIKKYGKYVDNYKFLSNGNWKIYLRVVDNCGNTSEIYNDLVIGNDSETLSVSIDANPVVGVGPLKVDFNGLVSGGEGKYKYEWNFGDGEKGFGKNIDYIYKQPGVYDVKLKVIDENGNIGESEILVKVLDKNYIKEDKKLALKINIYDKNCDETKTNCSLSDLKDSENTYDFNGELGGICEKGINLPEGYIWRYYNKDTKEEIKKYGKYVDNYKFLSDGNWRIYLKVIDNCGNTSDIYSELVIGYDDLNDNLDLSTLIKAEPIIGKGPLKIDFTGLVNGGEGNYKYEWNFGDGEQGFKEKLSHIYSISGTYLVKLKVIDKKGNTGESTVTIKVNSDGEIFIDSDKDGISDLDDDCPLINGSKDNNGCPIFDSVCNPNNENDCNEGYECIENNFGEYMCLPKYFEKGCNYSGGNLIFGEVICNSCPCDNKLDFISTLRKCDKIFPAITSPDDKTIYSQGNIYEIK